MKSMFKKERGFTIVELLIVIVVIGILAAIVIVAFNGIQNRGYDTSVKSDLSAISKKYELYKIDSTNDRYPFGTALNDGNAVTVSINKSAYDQTVVYNLLNCTNPSAQGSNYAVLAVSKSGKKFYISSATGSVQEYTGSTTWLNTTNCTDVLAGSGASGAGFQSASGWRAWIN